MQGHNSIITMLAEMLPPNDARLWSCILLTRTISMYPTDFLRSLMILHRSSAVKRYYFKWPRKSDLPSSSWRHQMETFSALLALCAGNSQVTGELPTQRPVTGSFDFYFDLHLNKRLSKQSWGWWFETLSRPLWRHCNDGTSIWLHNSSLIRLSQCQNFTFDRTLSYGAWNWYLKATLYWIK